tara:strand:- start:1 stop:111 length:111 start_codon:yes stop_codon:yes gene_type:complete
MKYLRKKNKYYNIKWNYTQMIITASLLKMRKLYEKK